MTGRRKCFQREAIEAKLGRLAWENGGDKGWVIQYLPENDPTQTADWPRQHQFLAVKAVEFFRALDPFVQSIKSVGQD